MIEQAIYEYLLASKELAPFLTRYAGSPAVFYQEAPTDTDPLWEDGAQYGRLVFSLDVQGDAARAVGGVLSVDLLCQNGVQLPEEIEPVVRRLIDGCFFSDSCSMCSMAAQWTDSRYFTEPVRQIAGVTLSFTLLSFPVLTTWKPDIVARLNAWTSAVFPELLVINHDRLLPTWKPDAETSAVYWRVLSVKPANWIPDTWQTIWRTASLRCHIFSANIHTAALLGQEIIYQLYQQKRLLKTGEAPILVNRDNRTDPGADALHTGQITVEATFGELLYPRQPPLLNHIHYV